MPHDFASLFTQFCVQSSKRCHSKPKSRSKIKFRSSIQLRSYATQITDDPATTAPVTSPRKGKQVEKALNLPAAPSSSYSTLRHRIRGAEPLSTELVERCCTHASFVKQTGDANTTHNLQLATLGNELLGLIAAEYVDGRWPNLPTSSVSARVNSAHRLNLYQALSKRHCQCIQGRQHVPK